MSEITLRPAGRPGQTLKLFLVDGTPSGASRIGSGDGLA